MAEVAHFVRHGSSKITERTLQNLLKQLPMLKVEFTLVSAPQYPHLVDQLELLADVVEDYAEGKAPDMPLNAVAAAAFAITYAHRKMDLIPDFVASQGHADDSAVVRAALIEYEVAFQKYAEARGLDWSAITVQQ
ncbi:MAG: hypothetical protein ACAI35_15105 [Candidatus Methylacidiphilales bacterium]|nr:hypothetical protein [Candidatus Methylacidiphilales bacterium]